MKQFFKIPCMRVGGDNSGATLAFRIARLVDIGNGVNEIDIENGVKIYPNPAQ